MDSNIKVYEHLYSHIKYWDVSFSFADRIILVTLKEYPFSGKTNVVSYLLKNGFNQQPCGIYTRFKNRLGHFISQDVFDNENTSGLREEMLNKIMEKMPL
jgi:hypothetical protein